MRGRKREKEIEHEPEHHSGTCDIRDQTPDCTLKVQYFIHYVTSWVMIPAPSQVGGITDFHGRHLSV